MKSCHSFFSTASVLMTLLVLVVASPLQADVSETAEAKTPPRKLDEVFQTDRIRVAIYTHAGWKSSYYMRFLNKENGFECAMVSPQDIREGVLDHADVIFMPGGLARTQAKNLEEAGREKIREFLRAGGGYFGICAGCYLATNYDEWSLHILNADIVDREHWARGTGHVTISITETGKDTLKFETAETEVFYGNGPLLCPGTDPDVTAYEPLAIYKTEIAKNDSPKGVMPGTAAIARGNYGQGRVLCISPHPEKKEGPYELILEGVRWAGTRNQALECTSESVKIDTKKNQSSSSKADLILTN